MECWSSRPRVLLRDWPGCLSRSYLMLVERGAWSGKEAAVTGPEIRVNPALVSPGLLSLFRRQVPRGQFEICSHLDSSFLASSVREH